jgi:hypothetical protein
LRFETSVCGDAGKHQPRVGEFGRLKSVDEVSGSLLPSNQAENTNAVALSSAPSGMHASDPQQSF